MSEQKGYTEGACIYCGQMQLLTAVYPDEEAANRAATDQCGCVSAAGERQINAALELAQDIFGPGAADWGYQPSSDAELVCIGQLVRAVGVGTVSSVTIHGPRCTCMIGRDSKGKITITRKESRVRGGKV